MKRLAKIFVISVLALLVLLAGLAIFIRIKYPSERLRQMLIATLAEKFHLQAQVESLSFHLFSGFTIKNLALVAVEQNRAAIPAPYQAALRIEEVSLSYRWRSLLAGRLDVDAITISRPSFSYWQAPDSSTNLDALLAVLQDTSVAQPDTSAESLPFDINLRTIQLHELRLNAATADTQFFTLGPLELAVTDLVVNRAADYRGNFKLSSDAARVHFKQSMSDSALTYEFWGDLRANIEGHATADSIALRAQLALAQNRLRWGIAEIQQLPSLHTEAEAQYHFTSSHLSLPRFTLVLDEQELLAARFVMQPQDSITTFALNVQHGRLDLDYLSRLLHSLKFDFIPHTLQSISATGALDFSNSALRKTAEGLRYNLHVRGENIGYKDSALGLSVDSSQVQLAWSNFSEDGVAPHTAFEGKLSFAAFDFPLDSTTMHTGPGALQITGELLEDFSPLDLSWNLSWRNVSNGNIENKGSFKSSQTDSSRFLLAINIDAQKIDLAPFTADTLRGRVSGALEIKGRQWDDLLITCALQHDTLFYMLEEDSLRFQPYHWAISSKLEIAKDFTDWLFTRGSLKGEPGSADFTARYQTNPGVFRFDLHNAALELSHVLDMLPPSYFEGLNPKLAGVSHAVGWMNFQFSSLGELEYVGKFKVNSDTALFTDSSLGIYADQFDLQSEWNLATNKTTGNYAVTLLAARMPDYIQLQSLPRVVAHGKIEIDDQTFLIKEGDFEAKDWHLSGNYRVEGKFLRDGMKVLTTVDADLNAPEPVTVDRGVSLQGRLTSRLVVDQFLPDDTTAVQPVSINAALRAEQLNVTMDSTLALHNLNADLNFAQNFDFLTMTLLSPKEESPPQFANAAESLLLFDILGEAQANNLTPASQFTIGKLQVRDYEFTDIAAKLNLGHGRCDIPQLRMNFLGGNLMGNVLVGYGDGDPDRLTYSMAVQVASVDVSRLRRLSAQMEKGAQLSADFYLNGIGASPNKLDEALNNLAGKLNITKIEKRTATNLLEALDPNGTDAGIQRVRFLLSTGWNVKHMTFEIKNGFIYASLAPVKTKPWSALFNLPTTLDFARLPIRYFMTAE